MPALLPADRPGSEIEAYAVQARLHELLRPDLGRIAGHKIGCTTPVMQAFLGIPNPCAGGVFESTVVASPAVLTHGAYLHVGVECEIVVRLAADLPASGAPYTRESVAATVEACMAAMEIVDDRYVDYKRLDTPTLIADDFFGAGSVLAAPVTDWRRIDLTAVEGVTRINDVEVGRGFGGDVMGHPLAALAWLANNVAARGGMLRSGEFVSTGSVVETRWVCPGDLVTMTLDELGTVQARFV